MFDGSGEHGVADPFRLTFANRSGEATSAVVFRIGPETRLAELEEAAARDAATAILGGGFMDVPSLRRIEVEPSASADFERPLEPGRWVIACVTSPSGTDRMYPAAAIEVG